MDIKVTNLDAVRTLILSRCSGDLLPLGDEDVDWLFDGAKFLTTCSSEGKDLQAICENLDKTELEKAAKTLIAVTYGQSCRPTIAEIGELTNFISAINPACSVRFGVGHRAENEPEFSIIAVSTY